MSKSIVKFAQDDLGLDLTPGQADVLTEFEKGGYSQGVWRMGRRSGKSLMSDVVACYDATVRDALRKRMRRGEPRVAAIVCPRLSQATEHVANCGRLLRNSPRLAKLITRETSEEIELANGSVIRSYPASSRGIRGGSWSSLILDELGHFLTSEAGNAAGDQVLAAASPSLAQFGSDGWMIAISTPLWRQGAFYRMCEMAESGKFPQMLSRHASTAEMNPMVDPDWLEQQRAMDPDLYNREYLAEWVDGASSFLAGADVAGCVRRGVGTLPPMRGMTYSAAIDPAFNLDNYALAIGHSEGDRTVVDGVWTWFRQGHGGTLDAITQICKTYGVQQVVTDQFASQPIQEGLQERGLQPVLEPWTNESKYRAFTTMKIALNTRALELPDDDALVSELISIEARPTPSGLTRLAAAGSGHDDRAVVVAAIIDKLCNSGANADAWVALMRLEAERVAENGEHWRPLPGSGTTWRRRDADWEDAPGLTEVHRRLGIRDPNVVVRPLT